MTSVIKCKDLCSFLMFEKPVFLYILILESKRKLVNVKKNNNNNLRAIQFIKTELRGFTKSANGKKNKQNLMIF